MVFYEERWEQWNMRIETETVQLANPDGSPRANPDGSPTMQERSVIIAIDPEGRRAIRLSLSEEGKQALLQGLTGGIVIPGSLPPHLPFGRGF